MARERRAEAPENLAAKLLTSSPDEVSPLCGQPKIVQTKDLVACSVSSNKEWVAPRTSTPPTDVDVVRVTLNAPLHVNVHDASHKDTHDRRPTRAFQSDLESNVAAQPWIPGRTCEHPARRCSSNLVGSISLW